MDPAGPLDATCAECGGRVLVDVRPAWCFPPGLHDSTPRCCYCHGAITQRWYRSQTEARR